MSFPSIQIMVVFAHDVVWKLGSTRKYHHIIKMKNLSIIIKFT